MTAPDPEPFDVVDADAADVETMFGIYLDVVAAGGAGPAGEAVRDVFEEGWIRRRRVYAARRDGVTVGGYFLRSNFPAMAGHIAQAGHLVVRSERGRGIGTRLLAHSLEQAARHGYRAMMFNLVLEDNPSRRFYERAGFQVIGRIPQAHGQETGLIYWRELPAAGEAEEAAGALLQEESAIAQDGTMDGRATGSALVAGLQARAARAVPAAVEQVRGGDWLRHTDSPLTWWAGASLLHGPGDRSGLHGRVSDAEDFATQHGAPTRLQVCPACPPDLDELLAVRGYSRTGDVSLQVLDTPRPQVELRDVDVSAAPTQAWMQVWQSVNGPATDAEMRQLHRVHAPSAYVTVLHAKQPVAIGRAVVDDGWTGVFGMATIPDARRLGAGSAVLSALARWSGQQGAPRLYLQVEKDNKPALGVYARAGFRELAVYHYRMHLATGPAA